jgi:hypothetical protein
VVGTFGEQPPKMLQAVGQAPHGRFGAAEGTAYDDPPKVTTAWGGDPHGWMGERLPDVGSDLWQEYEASLNDLERCCKDPSAAGCLVDPIGNKEQWLERLDAASR